MRHSSPRSAEPTIAGVVGQHATHAPARRAFTFIDDARGERHITYEELDVRARCVVTVLRRCGVAAGDRVVVACPAGLDFIAAFLGCLSAGAVAVPLPASRRGAAASRLVSAIVNAAPRVGLTIGSMVEPLTRLCAGSGCRWIAVDDVFGEEPVARCDLPSLDADAAAVVQYTSGSTAAPKGVVITHANLLDNQTRIHAVTRQSPGGTFVGWLPPFHDMGLVGLILHPLFLGAECVLLSPAAFLRRPAAWLEAIGRARGTATVAPNFALDLCVSSIDGQAKRDIDLGSLDVLVVGAEAVRHATLERFADAFRDCGFDPAVFRPCYGLAEATLLVSGTGHGARTAWLDVAALQRGRVVETSAEALGARPVVSCGGVPDGMRATIVDPRTRRPCAHGRVGEIWLSGPSVAAGYWNNGRASIRVFAATLARDAVRHLRTGDLGFLDERGLFVCGRCSDTIVVRGRNIHPEDLEHTAATCHPATAGQRAAAFSVDGVSEERVVIVQEIAATEGAHADVAEAIRRAVAIEHDLQPHTVVLTKRRVIPFTTSGKVRRAACRQLWLDGSIPEVFALHVQEPIPASQVSAQASIQDELIRLVAGFLQRPPDQIGPDRTIAELGLDSLAAARLQHALTERFGTAPAMARLMSAASIGSLSAEMAAQPDSIDRVASVDRDEGEDTSWRLAPNQMSLWAAYERDPSNTALHIGGAIRLRGTVDIELLRSTFCEVVARHSALRTTFHVTADGIRQHVEHRGFTSVSTTDARSLPVDRLRRQLAVDFNHAFDLGSAPPIRLHVYSVGADETLVMLVAHHLVSDFASLSMLIREWAAAYGGHPHADRRGSDYSQFTRWYEHALTGADGARLRRFWQERLDGHVPPLELPRSSTAIRPPARRSARCARVLNRALVGRVLALAAEIGVTPFVAFLAAFKIVLQRYAEQPDIAVSTPAAVRPSAAFQGCVGYFVNPIVIRSSIADVSPIGDFMQTLQRTTAEALDHSALPLSDVGAERERQGHTDGLSELSTMFVCLMADRDEPIAAASLDLDAARLFGAQSVERVAIEREHCQFDLHVAVTAVAAEAAEVSIEYDASQFELSAVERLIGHFERVLEAAVDDPAQPIERVDLLTGAEHETFRQWNATAHAFDEPHVLHDLVTAQARRTPLATAVSCGDAALSYAALDSRAVSLARELRAAGVSADRPVAVALHPGIDMIVALLAVLKAGAPYIPMDPAEPVDRSAAILESAGPAAVVTTVDLARQLHARSRPVICVDRPFAASGGTEKLPHVAPDSPAYIIYTSGSTGEPKGALISHRAICNRLLWMRDAFRVTATDRIVQKTPYTFDVSVWELFLPLIVGAELVVTRPGGHRDPAYLVDLIQTREATIVHFVPSMLRVILEEPGFERCRSLRHVFASGEALPAVLRDRFFARLGCELHNLYGPTEAAVDVTAWTCRPSDADPAVPIGFPISNVQLFVLDRRMKRTPMDVPGELYLAGTCLADGYWRRPDLTAERFVQIDVPDRGCVRAYRTGDRARYRSDGRVEFLGRLDGQVKVRGVRIELEEVEAALRQHPAVRDCAVRAVPVADRSPFLAAYLIISDDPPTSDEMREFLRQRLPEAFVPSAFCVIERVPTTSSGKARRAALPDPAECRTLASSESLPPATAEEAVLAAVWRDVLGVPAIGVTDNFFARGGDSLRCLQVRIRTLAAGYSVTTEDLFAHPTVRALAGRMRPIALHEAPTSSDAFSLAPASRRAAVDDPCEDAFPLSRLQEALLYVSANDPGYEVYVLSLRIAGVLAIDEFRASLAAIVQRHPMLRVSYDVDDPDQLMQIVHGSVAVPLRHIDLSGCGAAEQERVLDEWIAAERHVRFDWTTPPLVRVALHELGADAFQLTISHALYDGWSLSTVLVELLLEYSSRLAKRPSPLPAAPSAVYRDFVAAERAAAESAGAAEFWRGVLADAPPTRVAGSAPGAAEPFADRLRQQLEIPEETAAGLRRLARSVGAPVKSVLLAAHVRVLAALSGHDDVTTGLITNGRLEQEDGDRVVGLFLNTVPLRVTLGRASWRALVSGVFAAEQRLWPFRRFPLAEMRRFAPETPFDVAFNYVNFHNYEALRSGDVSIAGWRNPSDLTYFPVCAYFTEDPLAGRLLFSLDYQAGRFDAVTAARVAAYYVSALTAIVRDPDACAADAVLLSDEEIERQLAWSRAPDAVLECDRPVHVAIEAVAALRPDAPAVRSDSGAIVSYAELNARANQLARLLRARGAGAGAPIGLAMDRTPDLIAAVLACLKAGACFVPLNAALPRDRLRALVDDAGLRLILADRPDASAGFAGETDVVTVAEVADPATYPRENLDIDAGADALAYIMYTSGSTGAGKGVEVSRRALASVLRAMGREVGIVPEDRWLAVTALSFDIALLEILLPLIGGGTVVLASAAGARDGRYLIRLIEASDATIMQATPSTWRLLVEGGWQGSPRLRVLCGGEPLPRTLADGLLRRCAVLWNVYGPTETTIWATIERVRSDADDPPIGRPLASASVYVLDAARRLVPAGVAGELFIGGRCVARGYRNREEHTRRHFVDDPFDGRAGMRLYRTGDKVRWRADGTLEFLGRLDDQVKVRGHRIEPAEIELRLRNMPGVADAVVVVYAAGTGDARLLAYVVPRVGSAPDAAAIRQALGAALPPHMVPSSVIVVDDLPATPNGKVDRKALAAAPPPVAIVRERTDPGTATERLIADAWKCVLGVDAIDVSANVFNEGAHSLLAMRVALKLTAELGVELAPTTLFQYPTIAGLARYLDAAPVETPRPPARAVSRRTGSAAAAQAARRQAAWGSAVPRVDALPS